MKNAWYLINQAYFYDFDSDLLNKYDGQESFWCFNLAVATKQACSHLYRSAAPADPAAWCAGWSCCSRSLLLPSICHSTQYCAARFERALDHPKRMLHCGSDSRHKLFCLDDYGVGFVFLLSALRFPVSMALCQVTSAVASERL